MVNNKKKYLKNIVFWYFGLFPNFFRKNKELFKLSFIYDVSQKRFLVNIKTLKHEKFAQIHQWS